MKKLKIFMYSLIALLVLPCAILFVACGKNEEAPKKETCAVILVVDGHQYKTEEVEKGTALTEAKLADLIGMTKTGYTFNGWYRDSALTEKYNYDSTVSSPIVLFSEYNINKYNVTYVLDNGADNIVIREDYGTALPTPSKPVRTGYTFVGWDKDIPTTMPAENVTITACWRHFTVSVDTNIEGAATLADYTVTNVFPGIEDIGGTLNVDVTSVNMGYTFVGWYEGTNRVATKLKYSHPISTNATELVAKFEVDDDLDNFNFTSTPTTLTITGVKNKTVKEIAIPKKVTSIAQGALAGIDNLEKLEIPFVGASLDSPLKYAFGYIFSNINPVDDHYVDLSQHDECYKEDGTVNTNGTTVHYYVPISLTELILNVEQTTYGKNVFENLSELTNLEKVTYKGKINQWLLTTFSGQYANPMNSTASKFYCLDEDGNSYLLTKFTLPTTIKEIKANSFIGFSCLEKIVLHNAIKNIRQNAFKDFAAGDIEFYYVGTPEQWTTWSTTSGNITSGNNVLTDTGAKVYYYSENRPSTEELALHTYWYYDEHHELQLWS